MSYVILRVKSFVLDVVAGKVWFFSDHLKKIKKWSVSENQLLRYVVAEESRRLTNGKQLHILQLSCVISAFSESVML